MQWKLFQGLSVQWHCNVNVIYYIYIYYIYYIYDILLIAKYTFLIVMYIYLMYMNENIITF